MKKPGIFSKKAFLAALIMAGLAMTSFTQAFAANMNFKDITASKYDWARPYIEKMYLNDIVKGVDTAGTKFAPDSSVKRDEIVTMIIRLMGLDTEAEAKSLPTDFPNASSVPAWARGYVAVAVEKGIISGSDLTDFRAEENAKRYEVAIFAVRALGLEEEAKNMKNVDLTFTDLSAIPLEARAYVQLALENGIIKGFPEADGKYSFKPNDNLTRAQAAAILSNLSKKLGNKNMITGIVQDVDSIFLPSVTLQLSNGSYATYNVEDSTSIYKENDQGSLTKISLSGIKVGDSVAIIAAAEGGTKARFIEVYSKDNTSSSGSVVGDGSNTQTTETKITGILRTLPVSVGDVLIIKNNDTDKNETYTVASSASIRKDGKTASLSDLRIGDFATITVAGSKVIKIEAESETKYVSGTFKSVSYSGKNPVITIEDEDGDDADYEVDEDVYIKRNSKSAKISDLKKGDAVDLTLEYNVVIEIKAKSVKRDISGTVKSITIADTSQVTITDEEGEDYTFNITSDTEILQDRKEITVYDLRAGYYLDMEVEGDDALSIDVTTRQVRSKIEGTVQYIHKDAKVIVVKDTDKNTKEIHYTSDTVFYRSTDKISINKVDIGDQIIATGKYDNGLFFAETIIDLTVSD
ncbi:MAG: hypothetical protein PWQ97_87 [Tepidanaerobacteraceae bacterium]|nr:hypothetical protein [Tepidanaerobacteraceae bacterium]